MERNVNLASIAAKINDLVDAYGRRNDIIIKYQKLTKESIAEFSAWDQKRFSLIPGEECFFIYEVNPDSDKDSLLYVVCVTGDSLLTAAEELMDLVARKF